MGNEDIGTNDMRKSRLGTENREAAKNEWKTADSTLR
jgi:hypothetical protein